MYKKIIISLLLCCFLLPFGKGQGEPVKEDMAVFVNYPPTTTAPNSFNLSNVKVYKSEYFYFNDKDFYLVSYKIDWERLMNYAAADLSLQKIILNQRNILFSYALSLEILQHQPLSNFYQKKAYYVNLMKQWLTAEEGRYLDTQVLLVQDFCRDLKNKVKFGKFLLEMSPDNNCNYYNLYADSLIAECYALEAAQLRDNVDNPIDAVDNEAVIRARWAEQLRQLKQYDKAIYQQEKVYEIRKKRDDYLSYSVSALINIYKEAEQTDKLLNLYKDILSIEKAITTKKRKISVYLLNAILLDKVRLGFGAEAIDEFEFLLDYLPNADVLISYNPYSSYLRTELSDPEWISIARRWVASIRNYVEPKKLHCGSLAPIMNLNYYSSKEMSVFMQELFESFCFDEQKATAWGNYVNSSGQIVSYKRGWKVNDYWFSMQPYFTSIPLMENNAEKLTLIKRWMEMALRTKQADIIKKTASEAAYHLGKIGEGAIADSFFVNYYCEYLPKKDDNKEVWNNLVPYPGVAKNSDDGDKWMRRWEEVVLKYATTERQTYSLGQIARYYLDKGEHKKGYELYEKRILLAHNENEIGEELSLQIAMVVALRRQDDPLKSLLATIQVYDLLPRYCKVYSEGDLCADDPVYLNNVVAEIVATKNLSKKDKNLIMKTLDKWLARMKGEDFIDMRIFITSAKNTIKKAWEKG